MKQYEISFFLDRRPLKHYFDIGICVIKSVLAVCNGIGICVITYVWGL